MIKFEKGMFIKLINEDKLLKFTGFNGNKTLIYCLDFTMRYTLQINDIDWDFTEKLNDFVIKENMLVKIKDDHWYSRTKGKIFKIEKILNFVDYNVYLSFEKDIDGDSFKITKDDIDFIKTLEINEGANK